MPAMSTRETVVSFERHDLKDTRTVFIMKSIDHPEFPRKKKPIRMDMYGASHCYQDGKDLKFLEFSYLDMKGWFPAKLMNVLTGSLATL